MLDELRREDKVRGPLGAGDRDVEPVGRQQERQPARHVDGAGCRETDDRDHGLLSLELIDGTDRNVRESGVVEVLPQQLELRVIGRHHDDVPLGQWISNSPVLGIGPPATEVSAHQLDHNSDLLDRGCRITHMRHRHRMKPRGRVGEVPLRGARVRVQRPVVGEPRDGAGDLGMHAATVSEEIAELRGQHRMPARNVPECGLVDGRGMRPLAHLRQLLGIPEK